MTPRTMLRAGSALVPAIALFASPALAQEATPATTLVIQPAPAPIPVPQAAAPTPAAPAQTATPPEIVTEDPAPVVAEEADPAPARATTRTTRRAAPARIATTEAPAAAPAPVAVTPAFVPVEPAAPVAAAPVEEVTPAPAAETAATTTDTTQSSSALWPLLAGLAVVVAGIGAFLLMRRRRRNDDLVYEDAYVEPAQAEGAYVEPAYIAPAYVEPAYVEPTRSPAAAMAAPIVADHDADGIHEQAELARPDAEEVAAITATDAPSERPWIELSFRPVRAATTPEGSTVDVELTIGNAGGVAAQDVRVSTFMIGDQASAPTEMDDLIATDHGGTEVSAGTLQPGEGSRIDATLAVPRDAGGTFQPVVVADVRYRLPNGEEGRTAASFVVGGIGEDEALTPLRNGDTSEDMAAALHGELERA